MAKCVAMVWLPVLLSVGGLALLLLGAESLVRGATRLATTMGMSSLAIGLTVVAFGTSAPELVVSVLAAVQGKGALAMGNVVGSNVFNVLLVLGASALVHPLVVQTSIVRREVPILVAVGIVVWVLAANTLIGRVEGALLAVGLVAFTAWTYYVGRQAPADNPGQPAQAKDTKTARGPVIKLAAAAALVVAGILMVGLGARLAIDGFVDLAGTLGLSDRVVGITMVAAGTSIPELATSLTAALRRQTDIAVGNVVGSNVFNLLGVLGVAALVRPLEIPVAMARIDMSVMVLTPLAVLPLLWTGYRLSRLEGALLLAAYAAYMVLLFRPV